MSTFIASRSNVDLFLSFSNTAVCHVFEWHTTCYVTGVATMLRAGCSGFRMPVGASVFSRHQNFQTRFGTHLDSYSVATWVLLPRKDGWGVNETTHLHLVPRLSMSGAVRLIPLYTYRRGQGKLSCYLLCWVLLSVPQTCDQRWTYAACWFEVLKACLRKTCTSIYKPTRRSTCGARDFYPLHSNQRGCGDHSTSYSEGTMSSYPAAKASEAWSWQLSLIGYRR
jgi:hypothetical protein